MTDQDYESFRREYLRLSAALERFKQSSEEQSRRLDAYFHALKAFPLGDVIAKADTWLAKETKFPKPAEWAGVVVHRAVALPILSREASQDYQEAERNAWEKPPCTCSECKAASVDEKPIRFVPDEGKVFDPHTNRVLSPGRWIHGWELFRWYQARADFYNRCVELGLRGDILRLRPTPKARPQRRNPEPLVMP